MGSKSLRAFQAASLPFAISRIDARFGEKQKVQPHYTHTHGVYRCIGAHAMCKGTAVNSVYAWVVGWVVIL